MGFMGLASGIRANYGGGTPYTAPVAPTDYAAKAEMEAQAERQRRATLLAKGRSSTMLTGGMGLPEDAPVQAKTLLGQ